jgi:Rap1a immunity proteins
VKRRNDIELAGKAGVCAGAVLAVVGCHPATATLDQLVAVVVKYIDEHPEDMHLAFRLLAHRAFLRAWPEWHCKH